MAYPKKFVDIKSLEQYCSDMLEHGIIPNPAVIIPKELYDNMRQKEIYVKKMEVINDNGDGTITVRIMNELSYEEKKGNAREF